MQKLRMGFGTLGMLMITLSLNSQDYHPMPVGEAQWDITRCWGFYPGGWHDEYAITLDGSDTTINGKIYKKMFLTTHHLPGTQFDSVYVNFLGGMRESNKQVFFISEYLTIDTLERMVYDFNEVSPGDTIYTQILTNGLLHFIPHIVQSEDVVLIGQESHRRIHLTDVDGHFHETWTEGVGSNLGLVYASYWLLTDNSYDLNCFYDAGELQYTNPSPEYMFCTAPLPEISCPLTTSFPDHPQLAQIQILPNPAYDYIQIQTEEKTGTIEIMEANGRVVMRHDFSYTISVRDLPPAVYLLRIRDTKDNVMAIERFVKM